MLNKVILIGHVGHDPEIKDLDNGKHFAVFNLATSERWKDRTTGEKKEKTEWHRIVVFDERLFEVVNKYVRKGSKLYLEGVLTTRKWTDKDGVDRYASEVAMKAFHGRIELLDKKESGGNRPPDESYETEE